MTANFAWPVCHRVGGDYNVVANAVWLGRPFRQPLVLPDNVDFSDGLELWLQGGSEAVSLFACFRCLISFQPATPLQPPSLKLFPTIAVQTQFGRLHMAEAVPRAFTYANVEVPAVRQSLIDLITNAYPPAGAAPAALHPVLREFKFHGHFLKNTPIGDRPRIIGEAVDHFFAHSAVNVNARLPVLAGDMIGKADVAFGGAAPPPDCPFGADAVPPRHFVFRVEERCGQLRHPLHDFWIWLNNTGGAAPPIHLLAPHNIGGANPHPVAQITGLILAPPIPLPRVVLPTHVGPIPMLDLANFHHRGNSRFEWHFADDGALAARLRAGQPNPPPNLIPGPPQNDLVRRMWGLDPAHPGYANDIADMALRFQVPCELIMAFLGQETVNLDERVVGFEKVDNAKRTGVDAALLGSAAYQNLAGLYMNATAVNRFHADVPQPWAAGGIVRPGHPLTWGDLAQLLDMSAYFRTRISPGLMQTLLSTVVDVLEWIEKVFNVIKNSYPAAGGPGADWWTYFGVANAPAATSGYVNEWLLIPRHAILVGTAYIRQLYNTKNLCHCFDPPLAGANYNAGSVRSHTSHCQANGRTPDEMRSWGMCYYGDYMTKFGKVYNAAVDLFNGGPAIVPPPPVRVER